ncbi:MAG: alpha/beta fold hydrolase [Candidatus Andersenbacteria bacterium]
MNPKGLVSSIGITLVGICIIAGVFFLSQRPASELEQPAEPASAQDQAVVVRDLPDMPNRLPAEGGPVSDATSLPAFAQRQFQGSNFTVGSVLAETSSYTRYYITYTSGDLKISGIMNVPKGEGPFPLLLLNHGYIDPAVYTNGRGLRREQDYLAREGYVVVHSDYRNHADSDKDPATEERFRLGYAEDVINAIHAIRAANLPYVDAERVGLLGHSMGGGVSWVIAVTQPDLVDAIVLFAPVSADARDNFEKWTKSRPAVAQTIIERHGSAEENPDFWDDISPQTFFNQIQTPLMIHHGTADDSVPLEWSERSVEKLKAAGKDQIFHVYPGEPHEFAVAWPQVMERTTSFFDAQLAS